MSAQPCSGAEAAQLVQDTLGDGFSLAGRRGFYFLYELLTGQATLTLTLTLTLTPTLTWLLPGLWSELGLGLATPTPTPSQVAVTLFPAAARGPASSAPAGHAVGAALLRMLPVGDSAQPGELMSILRALAANPTVSPNPNPNPHPNPSPDPSPDRNSNPDPSPSPHQVAKAMPRLEPGSGGVASLLSRETPEGRLLAAAHAHLTQHARVLVWPDGAPMLSAPPAPPARHEARRELPLRPVGSYRSPSF